MENTWEYGIVKSTALNVRKQPSLSAERWNNVWPLHRIALIKQASAGWYETLYRGEPAYVSAAYIELMDQPVPDSIVTRMMDMAIPELGRSNSIYFNGYGGKWCHRFADWLPMHAGMPKAMIPNTSNCGIGITWFVNNENSGGFCFQSEKHKRRMIRAYPSLRHLPTSLTEIEKAFVPCPGDYIYFRWKNASSSVNVSHVGIVRAITHDSLTTVEGNVGNAVVSRTFSLTDDRIVGYGHPAYHLAEQHQEKYDSAVTFFR